jgi:hypothetical protein
MSDHGSGETMALRLSLEARTTEELVDILRERDEGEWRPEVFPIVESILAGRNVPPVSASEPRRDSARDGSGDGRSPGPS